jgi:hypothetical protein
MYVPIFIHYLFLKLNKKFEERERVLIQSKGQRLPIVKKNETVTCGDPSSP